MTRPTTKKELLEAAESGYTNLIQLINELSPEQQESTFSFEDRDKNIRDILIHLHEWQNMMNTWYTTGMSGTMPVTPAPGYTWKTTPALNQKIWQEYQNTSLQKAKELLAKTHQEMIDLINRHSNDELFSKNSYVWTKTTTLGAYFISATSSHYDWAMKKIKDEYSKIK